MPLHLTIQVFLRKSIKWRASPFCIQGDNQEADVLSPPPNALADELKMLEPLKFPHGHIRGQGALSSYEK
jgi:hypothetical protein